MVPHGRQLLVTSGTFEVPSTTRVLAVAPPADVETALTYVIAPACDDHALRAITLALARGAPAAQPVLIPPTSRTEAIRLQQLLDAARQLVAIDDQVRFAQTAADIVRDLMLTEHAYCVLHDPEDGTLCADTESEHRSDRGLIAWCAHTGRSAAANHADGDPRYVTSVNLVRAEDDRIAVQPLVGALG